MNPLLLLTTLLPSLALASTPRDLKFQRACEPGKTLTIAAVGDVLLHSQLQAQVARSGHASLWKNVTDLIRAADVSYANHEGPTAEGIAPGGRYLPQAAVYDGVAYTGYPTFNYHPSLDPALVEAGFDIVTTSNNHAMDRGVIGADKTIASLKSAGLKLIGTRTSAEAAQGTSSTWHAIIDKNGFRLAWIGCSFSTNGLPDPRHQVLMCFSDADLIEKAIRSLAQDPTVDAVIVAPHWGEQEYIHTIEASQSRLARRFLNAGALAIIGNHPHVTKPWERVVTDDGRETFVIYSIGNFVSAQSGVDKQTSAVVYLGLTKRSGEKAFINGVRYVPLWMNRAPYTLVDGDHVPTAGTQLLASLLGTERRMEPGEKLVTNPECGPAR